MEPHFAIYDNGLGERNFVSIGYSIAWSINQSINHIISATPTTPNVNAFNAQLDFRLFPLPVMCGCDSICAAYHALRSSIAGIGTGVKDGGEGSGVSSLCGHCPCTIGIC